jgi:hypothetical protein
MKATLIKSEDSYILKDGLNHVLGIDDKKLKDRLECPYLLSKQNCDEIFGVVDVEKLAEKEFDRPYIVDMGTDITPAYQDGFKIGFNKAMELYQPTEIEVEIDMQCLDPTCDGINRKGICIPGDKPKLDSEGCLILKKI